MDAARPAPTAAAGEPLDINRLAERWDALVERLRAAGKPLLATALEHSSPRAVTAKGDVTIELDEAIDFYARAVTDGTSDILAALREWFPAVQRIQLAPLSDAAATPPRRMTTEMVRAERIASLRKRDPILSAAIDALDLDVAD